MENCSHKTFIRIRTDNTLHDKFKQYCTNKDTTMSKVLIDYITTLVGNAGKSPARKKNSVKYQYCDCGIDLFTLPPQDRLLHVQNCKNGHNR